MTRAARARTGRVDELLQAYDRERRVLPPPVRMWQWGWTKSAETWNGRIGARPPRAARARAPGAARCITVLRPQI